MAGCATSTGIGRRLEGERATQTARGEQWATDSGEMAVPSAASEGLTVEQTLRAELWLPKRLDAPQQSVAVVKEVTGGKAAN